MGSKENLHERKFHLSKSDTYLNNKQETNGLHQNGVSEKPQQYKLVPRSSLPNFLVDNEYLLNHHRPHIPSVTGCVHSLCGMHTETINIWTHLIGCVCMLILMLYYLILPSVTWTQKFWFLPFFVGSIVCMFFSAAFHSFNCYSQTAYSVLVKLDYAGVIVLIVSSFPPWLNYGFYCQPVPKVIYLVLIVALGIVSIIASMTPKFATPPYRKVRAALFMALGLTGLVPGIHFFYIMGFWNTINYGSMLIIMALWYLFGGTMYALRVPERFKPGRFDLWCQSHQILHVAVIMGVLSCYIGITRLADLRLNTDYICPT